MKINEETTVSEEQACNYVRYRHRDEHCPNGGYATNVLGDCMDEGEVLFEYKAYEID